MSKAFYTVLQSSKKPVFPQCMALCTRIKKGKRKKKKEKRK